MASSQQFPTAADAGEDSDGSLSPVTTSSMSHHDDDDDGVDDERLPPLDDATRMKLLKKCLDLNDINYHDPSNNDATRLAFDDDDGVHSRGSAPTPSPPRRPRGSDEDDGGDSPSAADIPTEHWHREEALARFAPWRSRDVKYLRVRLREAHQMIGVLRDSYRTMLKDNISGAEADRLEVMYQDELQRLNTLLDDKDKVLQAQSVEIASLRSRLVDVVETPEIPPEFVLNGNDDDEDDGERHPLSSSPSDGERASPTGWTPAVRRSSGSERRRRMCTVDAACQYDDIAPRVDARSSPLPVPATRNAKCQTRTHRVDVPQRQLSDESTQSSRIDHREFGVQVTTSTAAAETPARAGSAPVLTQYVAAEEKPPRTEALKTAAVDASVQTPPPPRSRDFSGQFSAANEPSVSRPSNSHRGCQTASMTLTRARVTTTRDEATSPLLTSQVVSPIKHVANDVESTDVSLLSDVASDSPVRCIAGGLRVVSRSAPRPVVAMHSSSHHQTRSTALVDIGASQARVDAAARTALVAAHSESRRLARELEDVRAQLRRLEMMRVATPQTQRPTTAEGVEAVGMAVRFSATATPPPLLKSTGTSCAPLGTHNVGVGTDDAMLPVTSTAASQTAAHLQWAATRVDVAVETQAVMSGNAATQLDAPRTKNASTTCLGPVVRNVGCGTEDGPQPLVSARPRDSPSVVSALDRSTDILPRASPAPRPASRGHAFTTSPHRHASPSGLANSSFHLPSPGLMVRPIPSSFVLDAAGMPRPPSRDASVSAILVDEEEDDLNGSGGGDKSLSDATDSHDIGGGGNDESINELTSLPAVRVAAVRHDAQVATDVLTLHDKASMTETVDKLLPDPNTHPSINSNNKLERYRALWRQSKATFADALWCVRDENQRLRAALERCQQRAPQSKANAAPPPRGGT